MLAILPMFILMLLMPIWLPLEMIRYLITDPAMFWKLVNVIIIAFQEWVREFPQTIEGFKDLFFEFISMLH